MQDYLNGGSPGSGAKVLSIYWFTMEEGQLLWTVNLTPPPPTQWCACVASYPQPGKDNRVRKGWPSVGMGKQPSAPRSCVGLQQSQTEKPGEPESHSMPSMVHTPRVVFPLAEVCPQGQVLMRPSTGR